MNMSNLQTCVCSLWFATTLKVPASMPASLSWMGTVARELLNSPVNASALCLRITLNSRHKFKHRSNKVSHHFLYSRISRMLAKD